MKTAQLLESQSSFVVAATRPRRDRLTAVTVLIAGVLGISFALLIPPFQCNDEHGHFARAYQISRGEIIGHTDPQLPAAVLSSLLRYPEGYSRKAAQRTSPADLFAGGAGEGSVPKPIGDIHELNYLSWGIRAYQVYWPVCYLPAAAGIRLARLLDMSPVGMVYAGRLMNLTSFLLALATALWLAPRFRAVITGLALMPMTLQQAGAVSADSVTISFALTGFALILRPREQPVSRRYLAIVFAAVAMWAMCKNSVWALPLLLLIPSSQFNGKFRRAAFVLGAALVTLAALVLWRMATYDAFAQLSAAGLSRGINISLNAWRFASHPLRVLYDVITIPDPLIYVLRLTRRFVGAFGWNFVNLPAPMFPVYLAMLAVVAYVERTRKPFAKGERLLLSLVFGGALLQTYLMIYVMDGTFHDGHYAFWSAGVQGRYLIPYSAAGFLAFKQNAITVSSRVLAPIVLSVSTLYGLVSLIVIARFFYA